MPSRAAGDTDIAVDDQGNHYFVDLEALVNLGTSVSNDNGNNWRKNPVAVQNTAVDRQWYTVDNGTTASAADNTVFLAFHETAVGTFIYSSPGSTGPTDQVGGLVWQNSSAEAPRPLAADATCGQIRFDRVTRNLYYVCNEGTHVRVTVGHVAPGQRTGIQFHNVTRAGLARGRRPGAPLPGAGDRRGGNRLHRLDRHERQQRLLLVLDRPGHLVDDSGEGQQRAVEHGGVPLGAGRIARHARALPGTRPTHPASPTRSRTGPTTRRAPPRSSGGATRA